MEVSFTKFKGFYDANKEKIQMPADKVGHHPINLDELEQWRLRMREFKGSDLEVKVKDLKKATYSLFADIFSQFISVPSAYENTSGYVPFTYYNAHLRNVAKEIVQMMPDYDKVYMYIPQQVSRSNTWVGLLLFEHLLEFAEEADLQAKLHIVFDYVGLGVLDYRLKKHHGISKIKEGYKLLETISQTDKSSKILGFIVDDMSYSGKQMAGDLPTKLDNPNFHFYAGVAYVSTRAKVHLQENLSTIQFFKSTIICPSFFEIVKQYKETNVVPREDGPYKNILQDAYTHLLTIIESPSRNKYFNPLAVSVMITPIYFDHKMADFLSIFTVVLQVAPVPKANNNNSECVTRSLITGCAPIPPAEGKESRNNCRGKNFAGYEECYKAYYKTFRFEFPGLKFPSNLPEKNIDREYILANYSVADLLTPPPAQGGKRRRITRKTTRRSKKSTSRRYRK